MNDLELNEAIDDVLDELIHDDDDNVIIATLLATGVEESRQRGGSRPGKAKNKLRKHKQVHDELIQDYFLPRGEMRKDGSFEFGPLFSGAEFKRRFRVSIETFNRILEATIAHSSFLAAGLRPDATGKTGISPLVKVIAAMRQLCYGIPADLAGQMCGMAESTAMVSLKEFCRAVVSCFKSEYLRDPTQQELIEIEHQFASVGFPGCIGCLDCSAIEWENCPTAWQGIMIGKDGDPTLRMEVVCDMNLRIWHLFFGLPGVMNDLNIISVSPLFSRILRDDYPDYIPRFKLGEEEFDWTYYLADGIYKKYRFLIHSLGDSNDDFCRGFIARQEGVRKSVERLFGALNKQFKFMDIPIRLWKQEDIFLIVETCCILHNMVVEERKDDYQFDGCGGLRMETWLRKTIVPVCWEPRGVDGRERVRACRSMRSQFQHDRLTKALCEHINTHFCDK